MSWIVRYDKSKLIETFSEEKSRLGDRRTGWQKGRRRSSCLAKCLIYGGLCNRSTYSRAATSLYSHRMAINFPRRDLEKYLIFYCQPNSDISACYKNLSLFLRFSLLQSVALLSRSRSALMHISHPPTHCSSRLSTADHKKEEEKGENMEENPTKNKERKICKTFGLF